MISSHGVLAENHQHERNNWLVSKHELLDKFTLMNKAQTLKIACLLCTAMLLQAFTCEAQSVIKIASSDIHSLFIKSDGSLWVKGKNDDGQLGNGTFDNVGQPERIISSNVMAVAAGINRSFFLKNDGSLWAMGHNGGGGALGVGDYDDGTNRPVQIVPSGVTAISAGDNFTLFLKDDGSMWAFGENDFGELGGGTTESTPSPKKVVAGGVVAIAAGTHHSLFVKNDGSLWGVGNNICGQLGDGTDKDVSQFKQIVAANVTAIAAGHNHSLFIKSDGSLWAMGLNNWGQVGDCTHNWTYKAEQIVSSNVTAVAAGYQGSIFLKNDGSLWAMGINWHSDYGAGIEFQSDCPAQIVAGNSAPLVAGYYYDTKLKSTASLWAKSFNNYNQPGGGTAKSGLTAANPPNYNFISIELINDGNVRLTYLGNAGKSYALDRSYSLTTPNWLPQITNSTDTKGVLIITNSPDTTKNNFWRMRSVP